MIISKAPQLGTLVGLLLLLPAAACGQSRQPSGSMKAAVAKSTAGMTVTDFTARREQRILSADTDGDGKVSKAEFLASRNSGKGDPARRFGRLDRNADGWLDKQEITSVMARRFSRLDTNGDGVVTPAERAAAKTTKNGNDPES